MIALVLIGALSLYSKPSSGRSSGGPGGGDDDLAAQGKNVFRNNTFGDQDFWGGTLQLHKAIEGSLHGGVGPGVSPATALAVGLSVDMKDALPASLVQQIQARQELILNDPATTLALMKLNAVVGAHRLFQYRRHS